MPQGTVYRDSIGRSDAYHNPYDLRHISNPDLKRFRAKQSADTLESQQQRLEKDILHRMQNGYFRLSTGRYVIIFHAGKLLLLALALPPYLFFYGIPKWMIMQGFPSTLKALKKLRALAAKFLNDKVNALLKSMFNTVKGYINNKIDQAKQGLKKALQVLSYPFRQLNQHVLTPMFANIAKFIGMFQGVFAKLQQMGQALSQFKGRVRHFFIYLPNNLAKYGIQLLDKMAEGFNRMREKILEPFQPVIQFASKVNEAFKHMATRTKEIFSKVVEKAIIEPYHKAAEMVKSYITQPIANWFKPKYQAVTDTFTRAKEKIVEAIERRVERAREIRKSVSKAVENTTKASLALATSVVQAVAQPVINLFAPLAPVANALRRAPNRIRKGGKKLIEKIQRIKEKMKKAYRRIIKKINKGIAVTVKAVKWAFEHLKKAPSMIWSFLIKAFAFAAEVFKRMFFIIRLLAAWLRVLFRYTMKYLSESMKSTP